VAKKNAHAVALGKLGGKKRVESLTSEELSDIARKGGKVGGRARADKLSSKRRSEIARKAAAARWAKAKQD
jgi:general stress protein YciG